MDNRLLLDLRGTCSSPHPLPPLPQGQSPLKTHSGQQMQYGAAPTTPPSMWMFSGASPEFHLPARSPPSGPPGTSAPSSGPSLGPSPELQLGSHHGPSSSESPLEATHGPAAGPQVGSCEGQSPSSGAASSPLGLSSRGTSPESSPGLTSGQLAGLPASLRAALPGLLEGTVALPGGRDRSGRPLVVIMATEETRPGGGHRLAAALRYCVSTLSAETRRAGLCLLVDARAASWRKTRACVRQASAALGGNGGDAAVLLVLRPDPFWENRRVDTCTCGPSDGELIYLPLSRLHKFIDLSELTVELGGNVHYNAACWVQRRMDIEKLYMDGEALIEDLENIHQTLKKQCEINENVETEHQQEDDLMVQAAQTRTLVFLEAGMQLISAWASGLIRSASGLASPRAASVSPSPVQRGGGGGGGGGGALSSTPEVATAAAVEAADERDGRERVRQLLERVEASAAAVAAAWAEARRHAAAARELRGLERGVVRVTEWILGPAEALLSAQHHVGFDFASAEELRQAHEKLELQCRDTYGQYAELLHKIDTLPNSAIELPEDLRSQRDFMDFVCRSFATRLERRRNVLITSGRFFRLVAEYFHRTSDVFENLVKVNYLDDFEIVTSTLHELEESQASTVELEAEVLREGEKLADMLSMPVKDALGRDVHVNYEQDIMNVHDLLEATRARRIIFCDRVELQKLTLKQVAHVYAYEQDATQAIQWLDDLFRVMLHSHSHVGCSATEIQRQKEEHQVFQETSKSTYEYGCQLLLAALALRHSCRLPVEVNTELTAKLCESWKRLEAMGQEQMTRLRVSAVFHRSVEEHCRQLRELRASVCAVTEPSAEEPPAESSSAEAPADDEVPLGRGGLHRLLANRERLLLEVGRMVRLGRLLRTRLREPLCTEQQAEEGTSANSMAVEAITERLAEVSSLAEQLDATLCASTTPETLVAPVPPSSYEAASATPAAPAAAACQVQRRGGDSSAPLSQELPHQLQQPPQSSPPRHLQPSPLLPPPPTPPPSPPPPPPLDPSHWQSDEGGNCASPPLPSPPSSPSLLAVDASVVGSHDGDEASTATTALHLEDDEGDEFVTASECTCTPTSRSASFHTASECGGSHTMWWDGEAATAAAAGGGGGGGPPDAAGEPLAQPLSPSPLPLDPSPTPSRGMRKMMQVRHEVSTEIIETTNLRLSYDPSPDLEFEEFHRSLSATRARLNASPNLTGIGESSGEDTLEFAGAVGFSDLDVPKAPDSEADDALINQLKETRKLRRNCFSYSRK